MQTSDARTQAQPEAQPAVQPAAEPDVIPPQAARQRLLAAIEARLGPDWRDEDDGWMVIHDGDYLMRLTRGKVNLDFQCDLLGEVTIEERPVSPAQTTGRLIAWAVLLSSLFLALALAQLAGVFNG